MTDGRSERPTRVYLDMNIWVAMTRGCFNGDIRWEEARTGLMRAVGAGSAVVPLSVAHYLELWHRSNQQSREQVGAMMRDESRYVTLSSPYTVRRREVRASISRFVESSTHWITGEDLIGHGAGHAFDSPHGRFRFVESLASSDGAQKEGPSTVAPDNWDLLNRSGPAWKWLQLVGTQQILENEGVDRTPEHRYGTVQLHGELKLRELLARDVEGRSRLWDILVTEELNSLLAEINEFCEELRIDPRGLFFSDLLQMTPPEAMRVFIGDLPSANKWARFRFWKHRDLTHPWEQHYWTDISALSVAVPYCDVVLTERRWTHLVTAVGLAERYDTEIEHGDSALEALLAKLP